MLMVYFFPLLICVNLSFSRLWDIECGACLRVLEGHEELVRCIRFDNKRIVSGAYDGYVWDWFVPSWRESCHLFLHCIKLQRRIAQCGKTIFANVCRQPKRLGGEHLVKSLNKISIQNMQLWLLETSINLNLAFKTTKECF